MDLYERLSTSFLDDFSYSLNDLVKFYHMVKSAEGLSEKRQQQILKITDADKRAAAFVIEKMVAVAGGVKQNSDNNGKIVRMIECALDYELQTQEASRLMVYLWRENGDMKYLMRVCNYWSPSDRKSRNFFIPMPKSPGLQELLWRLDTWYEHSLLEQDVKMDIERHFPSLKKTVTPAIKLPVDDIYKPLAWYEGVMEYDSNRDANCKPLQNAALLSTPKIKKKADASVQIYGDAARKKTWVTIAFRNVVT